MKTMKTCEDYEGLLRLRRLIKTMKTYEDYEEVLHH